MAIFVWGAISHMALPLGEVGIQTLPDDSAITTFLKDKIKSPGLYLYPGEKDMSKMEQILKERPRGLLTYTPAGTPFSMGASLGVQCLIDILVGLLLAYLLSKAALPGLGEKLLFSVMLILFATTFYLAPYCNWYGFPIAFVLANTIDGIISGVIGALVVTKWMRWQ